MAAFVGERVRIRDTSVSVSVPQNSKAKLMYYLNCVATVIQLDDPALSRLKNYQSYYLLSEEETDALLALVILLSPDELIGKVFFPSEDCGGHSNQFYELSAVSHMVAVADNIVIGGERKRVGKIMFFQRSWMENKKILPRSTAKDGARAAGCSSRPAYCPSSRPTSVQAPRYLFKQFLQYFVTF